MKHALLVGIPYVGARNLNPTPNLLAMELLLADIGGWEVETLTGDATSRDQVLDALERLVGVCRPREACLFYFFGHGGVVRFSGLTGDLGRRAVFYLATLRPPRGLLAGVLDFEVSAALTRLDRISGNVTAILDCCHAAAIVRDGDIPIVSPPPWVIALAQQGPRQSHRLAVESHPRIVRLFGSSSLRSAYAQNSPDGHYGRLTRGFVDVLREAELRCDRLVWDTVAHRVREQISQTVGAEDQRIVLAGPRQRLLFSSHTIALPRSAAFIPRAPLDHGWIRAGLLQGVETGDQWSVTALVLGDHLEPVVVAEARVVRVELDRSEVALSEQLAEIPAGASAIQQGFERCAQVAVEASGPIVSAVRASGLLEVAPIDAPLVIARVRSHAAWVAVSDADDRVLWESATLGHSAPSELLELLEERARAQRLLTCLERNQATAVRDGTLRWCWGRMDGDGGRIGVARQPAGHEPPRLHVGDRVWIEFVHGGVPPHHWFASVIEIGPEGRPHLLNTNEPDGMEVAPGPPVCVGLRAHRRHPGLPLHWPARTPTRQPLLSTLVMIASRRPFSLGHIVRDRHPDGPDTSIAQGMFEDPVGTTRGGGVSPPLASLAWTWGRVDFLLDPRPRGVPAPR